MHSLGTDDAEEKKTDATQSLAVQARPGILRDPIWQFIGAVLGLIAIFLTLAIFTWERPTKQLRVVILSSEIVGHVQPGAHSLTQSAVQARVRAMLEITGNQAIREQDYSEPISFEFPARASIVETEVLDTDPPNTTLVLDYHGNVATLSPTLLNPEDRAIIAFSLENMPTRAVTVPFTVTARIADVRSVPVLDAIDAFPEPIDLGEILSWIAVGLFAALLLYLLVFGVVGYIQMRPIENRAKAIAALHTRHEEHASPTPADKGSRAELYIRVITGVATVLILLLLLGRCVASFLGALGVP